MVSATQTLQHKPPENRIILLYSPWSFLQKKRDCRDIFRELKGKSWAAVRQGREIMVLFRCLAEKFLWDSLNLQKLSILQKRILQREMELEALKALAFPSLRWRKINPTLLSTSLPEDAVGWFKSWGQPKASPWNRLCQLSTAPPALVLPPQHCWSIKCLTAPKLPTGGTGNRSGKTSFTKLMCPGCCSPLLLAQRGRNTARMHSQDAGWGTGSHPPCPCPSLPRVCIILGIY